MLLKVLHLPDLLKQNSVIHLSKAGIKDAYSVTAPPFSLIECQVCNLYQFFFRLCRMSGKLEIPKLIVRWI